MNNNDPIFRIAQQRMIKLSAEIEAELNTREFSGPTLEILRRLRIRAAESLAELPFCNLNDEKDVVKAISLQNEVKRYDEWLVWMKEIIVEGINADKQISDEEREELRDMLIESGNEDKAEELGLINRDIAA